MYRPPFEITAKIIELISQISEKVGEIRSLQNIPAHIRLRKESRIKTIHSSLAIENNSLSIEQVTAILEGKRVLGSPREIKEVTNSIEAYELLLDLDPFREADLLKAHRLMMSDLVSESGKYRSGAVGIFDGEHVVHVAPPAGRVPDLMSDLFEWLRLSDAHPLIKSCVFHYEFEFIHPFQDGNGRMGRLWQTAILKEWREVFAWLPVETLIKDNQKAYYASLASSDKDANSTRFIEFMLSLLLETIEDVVENEKVTAKVTAKVTVKVTANQCKILEALTHNPRATQAELAVIVGITRKSIIENMKRLQDQGLIRRKGSDKNGIWLVDATEWQVLP